MSQSAQNLGELGKGRRTESSYRYDLGVCAFSLSPICPYPLSFFLRRTDFMPTFCRYGTSGLTRMDAPLSATFQFSNPSHKFGSEQ
jgi:hypothetical protein